MGTGGCAAWEFQLIFFAMSLVVFTITLSCCLNCPSLLHIGQFKAKARAKNGESVISIFPKISSAIAIFSLYLSILSKWALALVLFEIAALGTCLRRKIIIFKCGILNSLTVE